MSIRWTRTGQIRGAKVMQAIAWSKEISGWVSKKYGANVETWLDTTGTLNTIRWTADYPDHAAYEKVMTAVMGDPEYWNYVEKAFKNELFHEGVGTDTISKKF